MSERCEWASDVTEDVRDSKQSTVNIGPERLQKGRSGGRRRLPGKAKKHELPGVIVFKIPLPA